jgi:hypothetical protein
MALKYQISNHLYGFLSVPHRKNIMPPLLVQQVNAVYRFVTTIY